TGKSYSIGIGVYGMLASSSGIIHSLCFFLIGTKLWALGRRHGYTTQIQFFRDRLESNNIGLLLFPMLVGLVIPYLLIGVIAGGATIAAVTHGALPAWAGSLLICGVVLVYVFLGGMRGTAWANAFQTIIFMTLGVVTFVVIANELGGKESFLENLQAATQQVAEQHPEKLTRETLSPLVFFSFMLIPLSAGMFPHLFQHWLTAKSATAFKLSIVLHPLFIMIVWVPCVLIGTWATSATIDGQPIIPAGLPSDSAVLGIMVKKLAGPLLSGLLTAGILAAVMSSLDSQFLCLGTIFTKDMVLHYGGEDRFSDKQTVLMARLFIVGVVAVTFGLSLLHLPGVFDLAIWCFSGFTALVPLVVAAIYWKNLTKAGAYACVIAAAATGVFCFIQSEFGSNATYSIGGMLPVASMIVCSTTAMIGVSLFTKRPSEATLAKFFPVAEKQ
ncbi:MAG: sodium:solute symporter family protein, partial [Planctomycetes bacterium]|nr:sodium:solute symporter family protein [Planctomycetota bacterium]